MSETPKGKDQDKGDDLLRRLLKTPPQPKRESETKKEPAAPGKKAKRPTGES